MWWLRSLICELSGDWNDIAAYFTSYIADPTIGRRTIAFDDGALATLALARSGRELQARELLAPLVEILGELEPTLWLLNGTVGFAASTAWALGAGEYARPIYECAIDIIYAGHDDFPGASNFLSVARMAALMGREDEARTYFGMAREHLDQSGQRPAAVVDFNEAGIKRQRGFRSAGPGDQLARGAERDSAISG